MKPCNMQKLKKFIQKLAMILSMSVAAAPGVIVKSCIKQAEIPPSTYRSISDDISSKLFSKKSANHFHSNFHPLDGERNFIESAIPYSNYDDINSRLFFKKTVSHFHSNLRHAADGDRNFVESIQESSEEEFEHFFGHQTRGRKIAKGELINRKSYVDEIEKESDVLHLPVGSPIFINAMPTNIESYQKVYRKILVTARAKSQLMKFENAINKAENVKHVNSGVDDLKLKIDSSDERLMVILSHSENNGKNLIFPNGDEIEDVSVHSYCANRNKICLVLTCHGDDFDVDRNINVIEAIKMWNAAIELKSSQQITNIDFVRCMKKKRFQIERNKRVGIYISISVPFVGVTYAYRSSE